MSNLLRNTNYYQREKTAIIMSFVFFLLFLLGYFVLAAEPMP